MRRFEINSEPLSSDAFRPYGQVIEFIDSSASVSANQGLFLMAKLSGTAKRRNWLADLQNLRPNAKPNMCVFRIKPIKKLPFEIKLLERHLHSTQAFIPMSICEGG
jgi:ureidoglycolate lyase